MAGAVVDLFEDAGLRAVGDGIVNFQAADHCGPGCSTRAAGPRRLQALRREVDNRGLIPRRRARVRADVRFARAAADDVHAGGNLPVAWYGALGARVSGLARHPHGGAAQRGAHAEFAEQVNIEQARTAVQHIAEYSEVPVLDLPLSPDGGASSRSRRMGPTVRAISAWRWERWGGQRQIRARRTNCNDDDAVWAHGFERAHRVERVLFQADDSACGFMVTCAPRRAAAVAKADMRVEFSKKAIATVLPRRVANFSGMTLKFLERFSLIE